VVRRLKRKVGGGRFDFIAADLTDTCHLRCTFCGNDFSEGTSRARMDRGTFEKLVSMFDLVDDGGLMLSCRYEPFLHPGFLDLVETVPAAVRKKAFFTTSLTLPLSDEAIDRLAGLGLHHINVSVDSFREDTFEAIRRRAKFERFADNLERLSRRFAARGDATPLQFITVVVRQNVEEVPAIVRRCLGELGGRRHEVRHVFLAPHLDAAWQHENLVDETRWDWLERELSELGGRVVLDRPAAAPAGAPVALIVFADGRVQVHSRPEQSYRLGDIDDPRGFFRERLAELRGA
jgi:MoaA/NifB/PqqE/SkfB family radical SAM enzyme